MDPCASDSEVAPDVPGILHWVANTYRANTQQTPALVYAHGSNNVLQADRCYRIMVQRCSTAESSNYCCLTSNRTLNIWALEHIADHNA